MLDYNQLEALAAVVEEGGFERAGRALHITQSAVTQRIRQLEELTGQILLIRSQPPGVTSQGRALLEHFSKVRLLEKELDIRSRAGGEYPVVPVAVNADSLATWFSTVISSYMREGQGLLDIRSADQDVTHTLLTRGDVMGCISASGAAVRGCSTRYLGRMTYRFVCTEAFRQRHFPGGCIDEESLALAPKINFNRDDRLLNGWIDRVFPGCRDSFFNGHFVPSSEQFPLLIGRGAVCGMITEGQYRSYRDRNNLVDLSMGQPVAVPLYWHRWAIDSAQLDLLSRLIGEEAAEVLENIPGKADIG